MLNRKNLANARVPVLIAIMGLLLLLRQDRFASYRAVDVLQFVGSGMCFGAALVTFLRGPRVP